MTIVRWEPLQDLASLQTDMNRLFNAMFDGPRDSGAGARRWVPAMDLVETTDQFVLRADLPGLAEEDVKIEFENDVLTISGERRAEQREGQEGYFRLERSFGQFSRQLTLPKGIDAEGVTASFDRGVLEVRIPKPEAAKPRRIDITGARHSDGNGNGRTADIEGSTS